MPKDTNIVKIHTCYSIEKGEPRPAQCKCRRFITAAEADDMLRKGQAEFVIGFDRPKAYQDGSQMCMTGRTKQTPRGATIEKAHIERAYVYEDLEEQLRIEWYGFLTLMSRVSVGPKFVALQFESQWGREHDYGRPILYFPQDNRNQ